MTEIDQTVRLLRSAFSKQKFSLSNEKTLQLEVGEALSRLSMPFTAEYRLPSLNARKSVDIPDFLLEGGIAIECKLRGSTSKRNIFKQLERYAMHDEVHAIILLTNESMGLPDEANKKPLYYISLSAGWML